MGLQKQFNFSIKQTCLQVFIRESRSFNSERKELGTSDIKRLKKCAQRLQLCTNAGRDRKEIESPPNKALKVVTKVKIWVEFFWNVFRPKWWWVNPKIRFLLHRSMMWPFLIVSDKCPLKLLRQKPEGLLLCAWNVSEMYSLALHWFCSDTYHCK